MYLKRRFGIIVCELIVVQQSVLSERVRTLCMIGTLLKWRQQLLLHVHWRLNTSVRSWKPLKIRRNRGKQRAMCDRIYVRALIWEHEQFREDDFLVRTGRSRDDTSSKKKLVNSYFRSGITRSGTGEVWTCDVFLVPGTYANTRVLFSVNRDYERSLFVFIYFRTHLEFFLCIFLKNQP